MIDTGALRKKILKLAVTGNLSKQMDSDTPVSKELEVYVPAQLDIELEEIPDSWKYCKFDEVIINRDSERIPVSVADRKKLDKIYDYYGASGVIDKVDKYLFDKDLLLIGEDGANLLSRSTPIAFIARGKYWVNNHAHVLDATEHILLEYAALIINSMSLVPYVTGAAQPKLSQGMMNKIALPVAPLEEQKRIVDTVKAAFEMLDQIDKLQKQYSSDLEVLKSKIIDAGIQGKLTEQFPEDGPAEELLDQIAEEKKQLIKEKKIKATKALLEITEDEIPFEIPDNWKWVRLSEIMDVRDGTHDSPKYVEDGIPLVTSKNISSGGLDFTNVNYISQDDANKINERSNVDTGDILFAMIGTIGNPVIVEKDREFCIKNVALFKNFAKDKLDIRYVYWMLMREQYVMKKKAIGGLQPFISLKVFREYPVPLPPIAEQRRIADKLDDVISMC